MKRLADYFDKVNELSHAFLIGNVFFTEIEDELNKIISVKLLDNKKIDIRNNQDIFYLDQNESLITRDDVRDLLSNLSTTSQFSDKKIYIINGAEKITDLVANSLLKTLEEPKSNIYAFLITKNIDAVKETVKSRCQKIILNSNEEYLDENEELLKITNNMINYIEKNGLKSIALNNELYNQIADRDIFRKVINNMLIIYKKCLKLKINNETKEEDVSEIFKNNDIICLSKKILIINETINLSYSNLNKNLMIDRFIIEMWRC